MTIQSSPCTTIVEKFSHDGRGIARIAGKITFIDGALPQETVSFTYTRRKADFDEGRITAVLEPSPDRVSPLCPHAAVCGGCSLQHLASSAQISVKETLLLEILSRIGHCQPTMILPPIRAAHWHYRHKARLSVRYVAKKGVSLLGFRDRHNPSYIADIHTCPVLHVAVDALLEPLRVLLDGMGDQHNIAQIEVAAGDEEIALIIRHVKPMPVAHQALWMAFGQHHRCRIYVQPRGSHTLHLFYPADASLYMTYALPDYGLVYQFHPNDFTQINPGINRQMVRLAVDLLTLDASDVVLDLYCGLGNFSLPIAQYAARVIGVEGSQNMVERAAMNAKANHLSTLAFICADLETWSLDDPRLQGVNKLLLDPPRSGALAIVKQIGLLNPERIVYVSCHPVTLARDAAILVAAGYQLDAAGVMDMFPHTAHVESIAVFVKK